MSTWKWWAGCGLAVGLGALAPAVVRSAELDGTDGSGRKTEIHSVMLAKDQQRLLLQGGEQGRLWSLVIGQRSGEMTASILDHDGGFLVSGSCTLP
jgi:hypothetical protein